MVIGQRTTTMKKLKQFPKSDGWIYISATMTDKTPMSEIEIKEIFSFGKPADYEFGPIEQHGNKIHLVSRHKNKKSASSIAHFSPITNHP